MAVDEDLRVLDLKLKQLAVDYERYFLGARPREPAQLRSEVQKLVLLYSNTAIQNTAQRFRFSSLCSRYQVLKRRWDESLRQIEAGTFAPQRFRAQLHDRARTGTDDAPGPPITARREAPADADAQADALFDTWVEACRSCGQRVDQLTPDRLREILRAQEEQLRERHGDLRFRFRVAVENGRARLKASRVGHT